MNRRPGKNIDYHFRLLLNILIFLFFAVSCSEKDKSEKTTIIPEKTFIAILTDSYMADGLLNLPHIRADFLKKDSTSCYMDIIKSYGYSYGSMEKTINYYLTSKPKRLISIYDRILERLSEMESRIAKDLEADMILEAKSVKEKLNIILPDPGNEKDPSFSYTVEAPGTFTLSFSVTVYPDDLSFNPCFSARFSNADSSLEVNSHYLPSIMYMKDGRLHKYTVTGRITGKGPSILKGSFYDYENNPRENEKHAEIINIIYSYKKE